MSRSGVDTLSQLCPLFLKGDDSAFIAAIASGLLPKTNIGHSVPISYLEANSVASTV